MACRVFVLFLLGFGASLIGAPVEGKETRLEEASMPLVGAPRALRVVDERNRALEGSLFDAHPTPGGEVLFTRAGENTRNVWVASLDARSGGRFPVWRAQPLTHFKAPQWAARPVLAGERVMCLSNAFNQSVSTLASFHVGRLVRIDRRTGAVTAFGREFGRVSDLVASPDGRALAFAGELDAQMALWKLPLNARGEARDEAELVARMARRATWLDSSTLLWENISPNPSVRGLYRSSTNARAPQLVMSGGGEAGALSSGAGMVISARPDSNAPSQLYLLARDGSGLRMVPGTAGARRPACAPDGSAMWFDAPLDAASSNRALWLVPLQTEVPAPLAPFPVPDFLIPDLVPAPAPRPMEVVPSSKPKPRSKPRSKPNNLVAQLVEVRPLPTAFVDNSAAPSLAIFGTVRGARLQDVRLEVGAGTSPTRWTRLSTNTSSVTHGRLALWTPPSNARGVWTLRLSVDDNRSAVQSLLRIELPLPALPANRRSPTPVADLPLPPGSGSASRNVASRNVASLAPIRFDVAGVPAAMAPGASARVKLDGGALDKNVRLTARWVDFTLGTRHKWNLFYPSGASGRRSITLVAPTRAGQYRLIFALVRVGREGEVVAPVYNAPQQTWEGELGSVAFAVEVGAQ